MKQNITTVIFTLLLVFLLHNNTLGQHIHKYWLSANKLDTAALNSYPQKIMEQIIAADSFKVIVEVAGPKHDSTRLSEQLQKLKTNRVIRKHYGKEIRRFNRATDFVQTENKEIARVADSLRNSNANLVDFIEATLKWTSSQLGYDAELAQQISLGLTCGKNVNEILATNKGTCGEYTTLFCAVMRKAGIPTRYIVGLACKNPDFKRYGQHSWAEFYAGNLGWIHVDPSVGKMWSPAYYLKLWEDVDFKSMDVKLNELKTRVELIEE